MTPRRATPPARPSPRARSSALFLEVPSDRPTDERIFVPTRARVPRRSSGVESFDVNLETQKVMVKGTVTQEEVIEMIAKTGKAVEPWSD